MSADKRILIYDEKIVEISDWNDPVIGIYRDCDGNELQATLAMETAEGAQNYLTTYPDDARLVYDGLVVHVASRAQSGVEEKTAFHTHVRAVGKEQAMVQDKMKENKELILLFSKEAMKSRGADPRFTGEVEAYSKYMVNGQELLVTKQVNDDKAVQKYQEQYPDAEIVHRGNDAEYVGFMRKDNTFVPYKVN